ncbi:cell wall hydrolase [Ancylobacter terrae]|uniref:cell wall hydrolase n=1 Tax=Ancylobacter sp. sgz301288 TaxID=3342077 RepID=UPI00385AC3FC
MRVSRRRRRLGVLLSFTGLLIAGGSTTIGRQDIAGYLARQPGIAERARVLSVTGSAKALKMATFAWPSPLGAALPPPPSRILLATDVNRAAKADRLPLPVAGDRQRTFAGPASTAAASGPAGTGTDDAVIETETQAQALLAEVSAGDPTGDPAEIEAGDEAVAMVEGARDAAPEGAMILAEAAEPDIGPAGQATPGDLAIGPSNRADAATAAPVILASAPVSGPIYHDPAFIFGTGAAELPPQRFEHLDADSSSVAAKGEVTGADATPLSPAQRLGLDGRRRERAEKCLAEAVYFESRGEPERGQVGVAQVVLNRVFSGYYPADICRAVYQNANRKLACQFTFACDNIRDVVTEPEMWKQAQRIAADMLDGHVWDNGIGKATHYHAMSVRPNWIREMRKLDRVGDHTFYRPRRWEG